MKGLSGARTHVTRVRRRERNRAATLLCSVTSACKRTRLDREASFLSFLTGRVPNESSLLAYFLLLFGGLATRAAVSQPELVASLIALGRGRSPRIG